MIVLVGQSAAGKDTLCRKVLEAYDFFKKPVSYTTRPKRDDELNGADYYFVTKSAFEKLQNKGFFVCVNEINGWFYGIPRGNLINNGDKVLVLNPAGIRELKARGYDPIIIYLHVNDRIRLIRQILRGDDLNEVVRRYTFDAGQFLGVENEVDFIINDDTYEPDSEKSINDYLNIFKEIVEKIKADPEMRERAEFKDDFSPEEVDKEKIIASVSEALLN